LQNVLSQIYTVCVFSTKLHLSGGNFRTTEGAQGSIQRVHDLNTIYSEKYRIPCFR